METAFAKSIISEIANSNLAKAMAFHIMGEPLLHNDVVELCKYAEDLGISVSLFTNGALLNEQLNKNLFSSGLTNLDVSFRASNDFAFNQISNYKPLSFEEYKNKIKELLSHKLETQNRTKIGINFFKKNFLFDMLCPVKTKHLTYIEDNLSVMSEIQEFCLKKAKQLGKNTSKYEKLNLKASPINKEIFDNIYFSSNKLVSFFLTEKNNYQTYSKAFIGGCDTFRRHFGILANGDVTTCCLDYNGENVLGNLHNQQLSEILDLDKVKSIRKHFDKYLPPTELCKRCLGSPNLIFALVKQITSISNDIFKRNSLR